MVYRKLRRQLLWGEGAGPANLDKERLILASTPNVQSRDGVRRHK